MKVNTKSWRWTGRGDKEYDRKHDGAQRRVEATGVGTLLLFPLWSTIQDEAGKSRV